MTKRSHIIIFVMVFFQTLGNFSTFADFEGSLRLQQLSSSLEFSSDQAKAEEWFKYRIVRPPAPDLRASVRLFAKQLEKKPKNSSLLTRLALHLYYEIGENGRLLWKWNKYDYAKQMGKIDWDNINPEVKTTFDWVLNGTKPTDKSPEWLEKAVNISKLKIDTENNVRKTINELKSTPELLAMFIVEQVYKNPKNFPRLLSELKQQQISFPPKIAEAMFIRWKSLTYPRLAGSLLSLENSVIEQRLNKTRTAILNNPFWSGRQRSVIAALKNDDPQGKSGSVAGKMISIAERAQSGKQSEMASNLARAAILWYAAGTDLTYTSLNRAKDSPVLDSLPKQYREELAFDRFLIFMNRRSLGSFAGSSALLKKGEVIGDSPLAKVFFASCQNKISELKQNINLTKEQKQIVEPRWFASLIFLDWLKRIQKQ